MPPKSSGAWGVCAAAFALFNFYGAGRAQAPALPPVPAVLVTHGPADRGRQIALTFDACQTHKLSGYDAALVGTLKRTRTPATLMLGGYWMETHPAQTRALSCWPLFEIGSHSYLHPHMARLSQMDMERELRQTQNVQWKLTGRQGTLFRPPYGEYSPLLVRTAAGLGLHTFTWSVVTDDPDPHIGAFQIVHTVLRGARPGAIVIMHMNGRGWHTAQALPLLLARLKARGWRFVTVSQMLRD